MMMEQKLVDASSELRNRKGTQAGLEMKRSKEEDSAVAGEKVGGIERQEKEKEEGEEVMWGKTAGGRGECE